MADESANGEEVFHMQPLTKILVEMHDLHDHWDDNAACHHRADRLLVKALEIVASSIDGDAKSDLLKIVALYTDETLTFWYA